MEETPAAHCTRGPRSRPGAPTRHTARGPKPTSRTQCTAAAGGKMEVPALYTPRGRGRAYTVQRIAPAGSADVLSVARAMNRHNFPSRVQEMFRSEVEAARRALQSGIYIGWRCPEYQWDCIRVGEGSRCFCGHQLTQHQNHQGGGAKVNCTAESCPCPAFSFIPSSPEEVGEFWLRKRPGFDPGAWAAKCRCHHSHYEHRPTGSRACRSRGCGCSAFESSFLCAACDRKWGAHCTYFETMQERKAGKLPYGEAYLPFHEMPDLQMAALTGTEEGGGDNCMTCDLSLEATPLSSTPVKRANTLGGRRLGVGKPS